MRQQERKKEKQAQDFVFLLSANLPVTETSLVSLSLASESLRPFSERRQKLDVSFLSPSCPGSV